MEDNKELQKKWYKDIGHREIDGDKKMQKVTEWVGLIIVIAIGIYAFYIMHHLIK